MFSFQKQSLYLLGVVNTTPNSFSDGGLANTNTTFRESLSNLLPICDGIDVGAESTAPMNTAITQQEEQERLQTTLIPTVSTWPKDKVLSLDTYRPSTMEWLLKQLPREVSVLWNDVSGKLDEQVFDLLKRYSHLNYVYSYNLAPSRELSGKHMDYVQVGNVTEQTYEFFRHGANLASEAGVLSRIIADPCFGFAKSREQNHQLLAELPALMERLPYSQWMWAISRKSFLRFPATQSVRDPLVQQQLDAWQVLWVKEALEKLKDQHRIWIRAHAPATLLGLASFGQWRESWKDNCN